MRNHFKEKPMAHFEIPDDYESTMQAVQKIHYILNEFIRVGMDEVYIHTPAMNTSEEVFASARSSIIPYYGQDRLWFMRDADITKYKRYDTGYQSISEYLSLEIINPNIGEDEYFQYSTMYCNEEIFVSLLIAKLNTINFMQTNKDYSFRSYKIIVPAFIALYDFIAYGKKDETYDTSSEFVQSLRDYKKLKDQQASYIIQGV